MRLLRERNINNTMRKLKEFKQSMKLRGKHLLTLNKKLKELREKFAGSTEISRRNDIETEGQAVKAEIADTEAYLASCESAVMNWVDTDDKTINTLADFKYWRNK